VYGSVAMQGAKHDLTTGLDAAVTQYLDTADAWITTGENVFTTDSFRASGAAARIARTAGVASVRIYQGALLDVAGHRIWIRGRPAADGTMLQSSQLLKGDYATATRQLREGGWAAISSSLASERHGGIGDSFTLPTPSGSLGLRVAAITTNAGWPGGAITMSASTYRAGWQTVEPSALEVNFKPGTSPRRDLQNVRAALGYHPGLSVQSRGQREAQFRGSLAQGLRSLGQISTLLLLIAALSVAFALSAAIWQRRERLSSLKAQGFDSHQLWRSLLLESTIVLGVGCLDGVLFGIAGHATADRWLKLSTGFPAPFSIDLAQIGLTVLLVGGVALAVVAAPGLIAARVSPRASFEE
jgi:putative ABC transport system permease protein